MMAGRQPLLPWRRVQRAPAPTFRAAAPMILLFLLLLGLQAPRARGSDDDDDSDDCWRPPWDPPASIEADVRLAERVDEMIAGGQADEAVRQLRLALSPTVLEDVGRYWDAPHELLRRGLGRALLKASPAVCPDETACRAAALAQFVAAEKARRREDPLRAFVPLDAIELRPRDKWEPPPRRLCGICSHGTQGRHCYSLMPTVMRHLYSSKRLPSPGTIASRTLRSLNTFRGITGRQHANAPGDPAGSPIQTPAHMST